jgi:type VI secretion system secreted protein Hcp
MAFEAYVKVKGQSQGDFKGESTRKGREAWLPMLRFEWAVDSPKDVSTGASAGRRRHQPFTFWKELGASTPQIFQAVCRNENLTEVKVEFMRTNKQGQEEVYMTLDFKDAQVSAVKYSTGGGELGGEGSARGSAGKNDLFEQEAVSLTYRQVEVTHNIASTSAVDDWDTVYS